MRGLLAAVVIMGVLIVGGVITLGVTAFQRLSGQAAPMASLLLDEPIGTRVAGVSLAPDRLAVQLQGGGPDRVVMVDTRGGRVLGQVGLAR